MAAMPDDDEIGVDLVGSRQQLPPDMTGPDDDRPRTRIGVESCRTLGGDGGV